MISERAKALLGEEPPLVKAHFKCVADPFSEQNRQGYINFGTAENHLMDDLLETKLNSFSRKKWPFHYDIPNGGIDVRTTYQNFQKHFFAIEGMPLKNISISSGASSLIEILSFTLCDEGDEILTLAPLYNGFLHDVEARFKSHLVLSSCLSEKGVDFSQLEQDLHVHKKLRALLINNPHNPTGYVLDRSEIRQIIELAKKYQLEIIADEIYAQSAYSGKGFTSFLAKEFEDLSYQDHIHHVYGVAKDFCLSGFKLGFFSSFNSEVAQIVAQSCYFHSVSTPAQQLISFLLADLKWCESFIQENHRRIRSASESIQAQLMTLRIPCFQPEAGIFLWAQFGKNQKVHTFSDEMNLYQRIFNEQKVNIIPGQVFKATEPGWFRLCFAQPPAVVNEFLSRIQKI